MRHRRASPFEPISGQRSGYGSVGPALYTLLALLSQARLYDIVRDATYGLMSRGPVYFIYVFDELCRRLCGTLLL